MPNIEQTFIINKNKFIIHHGNNNNNSLSNEDLRSNSLNLNVNTIITKKQPLFMELITTYTRQTNTFLKLLSFNNQIGILSIDCFELYDIPYFNRDRVIIRWLNAIICSIKK